MSWGNHFHVALSRGTSARIALYFSASPKILLLWWSCEATTQMCKEITAMEDMREVTNPQTGGGLVEPPLLHHVLRDGNKVWRQPDNQGQQSRRFQHQSRRFGAQIGRKTHWALAKQLNKDTRVSVGPCGDVVPWGSTQMLFSGCKRVSSKCLFPFLFPVANHTKEKQFSSFCYRSPHFFCKGKCTVQ